MRRLAIPLVAFLLTGFAGCTLKEDKKSGEESKKSSDKPIRRVGFGGIFAGDTDDLANGGRRRKGNQRQNNNPQPNNPQAQNRQPQNRQPQNPANQPEPQFRETRVAGKRGIVGVLTKRVVDYKGWMRKHPNWRIIKQPGGRGGDPITVLASTYVNAASRISKLNFAHNLRIMAALNGGRYPTYKQYIDTKKKMRVELAKLPRGQVYAYREKKGDLVVLEDPANSGKIGD